MNTNVFRNQSQRLFTFYVAASLVLLSLMPVLPSLIPSAHAAADVTISSDGTAAEIAAGSASTNVRLATLLLPDAIADTLILNGSGTNPTAGTSALSTIPAGLRYSDSDHDDANDFATGMAIFNSSDTTISQSEIITAGTAGLVVMSGYAGNIVYIDSENDNVFSETTGQEDVFRRIHNGATALADGEVLQLFSTDAQTPMYVDDASGVAGFDTGEAIVKDVDGDNYISSGDTVITAGQANTQLLTTGDSVCFETADAEYDSGERIWYDIGGDCAAFNSTTDIILVGSQAAIGASVEFGTEQEVFFLDDSGNGIYTCTRAGSCEALGWTDGTNLSADDANLPATSAFFDSSTGATDGIATTGIGWDESGGTADLNDFTAIQVYLDDDAGNVYSDGEDIFERMVDGTAAIAAGDNEGRNFTATEYHSDTDNDSAFDATELIADSSDTSLGPADDVASNGTVDMTLMSAMGDYVTYYDAANAGYTDGEDIYDDEDNGGIYNGNRLSALTINNDSEGDNDMTIADFTNIRVYEEQGTTAGFQAAEDTLLETSTTAFASSFNVNDVTPTAYATGGNSQTIYIVGNFAATAAAGEGFELQIPANGVLTAGDITHSALNSAAEFEVYGAMTSTSVTATNLRVGVTATYTLNFTTIASVLNDDTINFTFPSGYNVAGAASGTCSTMDGSFATTVASQVVTLTRSAGTTETAGAQTCTIAGIINPTTVGSSGTFTFATEQATTTFALDRNAAVTAVNISAAAGSSSSSSSSASAPTTLALTSPNGGGTYAGNSTTTIGWTAGGSSIAKVNLSYSTDGGNTYTAIASNLDVAGSYTWTVPNVATTTGKVKVVGVTSAGSITTYEDISDANFTVTSAATTAPTSTTTTVPTVTTPTGAVTPIANVAKGSLVQGSGSAVYYYATDGKRYVFPNEAVYLSWYPDFSGVVKVSDADMATVQMSKRVTVRPGTWMIKIQSDPKVYAVEPGGVKRHVADETTAKALFGMDWNKRIIDVEPTMFPDYTIGAQVTSVSHPDGAVFASGGKNYLMSAGKHREISTAGFTANRFQSKFVLTPGSAVSLNSGDALLAAEDAIVRFK